MPLDVDVSDVNDFTDRAVAVFEEMPKNVFGFVEAGADILQNTDPYTDRSGDLRSNTQAVNVNDDVDLWHFQLQMATPYASYVRDLGFSQIDDVWFIVRDHISVYIGVTMPRQILGGF